jgi:hypothetical protein
MPAKQAFEYYMDIANARIFQQEIKPLDRHTFYAELKASSLADLSILEWGGGADDVDQQMQRSSAAKPAYGCSSAEREIADRCVTVNDSVLSSSIRGRCAEVMPQSLSK